MVRRWHILAIAVATAGTLMLGALPASASPIYGYDISWPQCKSDGTSSFDSTKLVTPVPASFAILGVNDGKPNTINPCLGSQVTQAGTAFSIPPSAISYYENTANPGSRYWPYGDLSCPTGVKHLSETDIQNCSYAYGWDAARYAYYYGTYGTTKTPVPNANTAPWWLDVESANSWTRDTAANIQDLKGSLDFLASVGAVIGGIYTNSSSWSSITGNEQSAFSLYRWWAPGLVGNNPTGDQLIAACKTPSLLGAGLPRYIQYTQTYDTDYDCG